MTVFFTEVSLNTRGQTIQYMKLVLRRSIHWLHQLQLFVSRATAMQGHKVSSTVMNYIILTLIDVQVVEI